mmetsp:Transcript_95716/g.275829  ORF Transcript_95716/g.275829 Transcript_95716/m.275829 type:complete len:228 (-) Transcript_95716:28-711(-)
MHREALPEQDHGAERAHQAGADDDGALGGADALPQVLQRLPPQVQCPLGSGLVALHGVHLHGGDSARGRGGFPREARLPQPVACAHGDDAIVELEPVVPRPGHYAHRPGVPQGGMLRRRVDGCGLPEHELYAELSLEHVAVVEGDVGVVRRIRDRPQDAGGELEVVLAVYDGDLEVVAKAVSTEEPSGTSAHDHDALGGLRQKVPQRAGDKRARHMVHRWTAARFAS